MCVLGVFLQCWESNPGSYTCKASTLPLSYIIRSLGLGVQVCLGFGGGDFLCSWFSGHTQMHIGPYRPQDHTRYWGLYWVSHMQVPYTLYCISSPMVKFQITNHKRYFSRQEACITWPILAPLYSPIHYPKWCLSTKPGVIRKHCRPRNSKNKQSPSPKN